MCPPGVFEVTASPIHVLKYGEGPEISHRTRYSHHLGPPPFAVVPQCLSSLYRKKAYEATFRLC